MGSGGVYWIFDRNSKSHKLFQHPAFRAIARRSFFDLFRRLAEKIYCLDAVCDIADELAMLAGASCL